MADLTNRCASFAVRAVDTDTVLSLAFLDVRNRLNRSPKVEKVYQKQGIFELAFPQGSNANERVPEEVQGKSGRPKSERKSKIA